MKRLLSRLRTISLNSKYYKNNDTRQAGDEMIRIAKAETLSAGDRPGVSLAWSIWSLQPHFSVSFIQLCSCLLKVCTQGVKFIYIPFSCVTLSSQHFVMPVPSLSALASRECIRNYKGTYWHTADCSLF